MIKFIEIPSGKVFIGYPPYIHWFDGPISTELYHYHNMVFMSDAESITISLPDSQAIFDIFVIPSDTMSDTETLDWLDFDSISNGYLTKTYSVSGTKLTNTDYYVYSVCLISKSDTEGEYIETLTINSESFLVGAEFYGENEFLKINLLNRGIEFPDNIIKSVYSADLYEEKIDHILQNRKWKELLSCYMDTLGCKGSYKSLSNSLKWFEYRDIVTLKEVWKHETIDGIKYIEFDINDWVSNTIRKYCSTLAKSTYFTLKHISEFIEPEINDSYDGITRWTYETDGERDLDIAMMQSETLRGQCIKWSKDEMRLKMSLLKNFFQTFFMPVHLNLINSGVEDIYLDKSIQLNTGIINTIENIDTTYLNDPISWNVTGNNLLNSNEDTYILCLSEVSVFGYVPEDNQLYSDLIFSTASTTEYNMIIGCVETTDTETSDSETSDSEDNADDDFLKMFFTQNFSGIGTVIEITATFKEPIISATLYTNIIKTDTNITTSKSVPLTTEIFYYTDPDTGNIVYTDSEDTAPENTEIFTTYQLHFKLLLAFEGSFYANFEFESESGNIYSKSIRIIVKDNARPVLKLFTLQKKTQIESIYDEIIPLNNMFLRTRPDRFLIDMDWDSDSDAEEPNKNLDSTKKALIREKYLYRQFISSNFDLSIMLVLSDYNENATTHEYVREDSDSTNIKLHEWDDDEIISQLKNKFDCDFVSVERTDDSNIKSITILWISHDNSINSKSVINYFKMSQDNTYLLYNGTEEDVFAMNRHNAGTEYIMTACFNTLSVRQFFNPAYYYLEEIDPEINNTISKECPIVCVPQIQLKKQDGTLTIMKCSRYLEIENATEMGWEVYSYATGTNIINTSAPITELLLYPSTRTELPLGMYKITFSWKYGESTNSIIKNCSFVLID